MNRRDGCVSAVSRLIPLSNCSVNILTNKPSSSACRPHTFPKIRHYTLSTPAFSFLWVAIFRPCQLRVEYQSAVVRLLSMGILGSLLLREWWSIRRLALPRLFSLFSLNRYDEFAVWTIHHERSSQLFCNFQCWFFHYQWLSTPCRLSIACFHVILFYPFQCQHQRAPYTQNPDVIQNLNAIVINDASNDATQYIVLNLIAGRWRRQITFSGNVDDYRQSEKANQQFYCY